LRVVIDPSPTVGYVVTGPGGLGAEYDPLPDIADAVAKKRRQLRSLPSVAVAVNLNAINPDPFSWGLRSSIGVAYGASAPTVDVASNVVGVIAFLRGIPGAPPVLPLWLANRARSTPEPQLLVPVLACLGAGR
jgi:hypothetical protein